MNLSKIGGIIAVANNQVAQPLLQVGAIPIIRRIVITYQQVGVFPIVVVVGGDDEELKRELSPLDVIFLKHDQDRIPELMDSVRTGLEYLHGKCRRMVFTPVNVPMFTPDTLQQLLATDGDIVAPSWQGKGGHPIVIADEVMLQILVTELTIHRDSAKFINRYGCARYFAHNQGLLLHDRKQELLAQIEDLTMPLNIEGI